MVQIKTNMRMSHVFNFEVKIDFEIENTIDLVVYETRDTFGLITLKLMSLVSIHANNVNIINKNILGSLVLQTTNSGSTGKSHVAILLRIRLQLCI